MTGQKRHVTRIVFTFLMMFAVASHSAYKAEAQAAFPEAVQHQTQVPEGYTAITTAAELKKLVTGETVKPETPDTDEKETESETESESESTTESETESESESTTESETESESESTTESETESESESTTESETESESESTTESETESESEPETEEQTEPEVEGGAVSRTAALPAPDGTGKYILMNDIDLSGEASWSSIAEFSGILDGNGYAIKGLKVPLIERMAGGTIRNLALVDVNIRAAGNGGALAVTLDAQGTAACEIHNVYVTGTVAGAGVVGGIAGRDISGKNMVSSAVNYAAVSSSAGTAGGVIGENGAGAASSYTKCANYGTVSSNSVAGGIVGSAYSLNGQMGMSTCTNTGNITGVNGVGGIIGYLRCDSTTAGAGVDIAGMANSGTVKGTSRIGGVAGYIYLQDSVSAYDAKIALTQSYNAGLIDSISSYSGGLAGHIQVPGTASASQAVKVENCYNLGRMKDGGNIAGEITSVSGNVLISKCFGAQIYGSATKGIIDKASNGEGTGYCTLSDCYYFSATGEYAFVSDSRVSGTATALSAAQAKTAASFKNFDFTGVWAINAAQNDGYPYLKGLSLMKASFTAPAKGTVLTDSKTEGIYKVTAAGLKVSYQGTVNTSAATVTIPSEVEIDGYRYEVTAIAVKAFYKSSNLTKVTVPQTVTVINRAAFYGCSKLKKVSGCKGVVKIYKNAFRDCTKLVTLGGTTNRITLPSAEFVGQGVFMKCRAIKSVLLSSAELTTIGTGAFRYCSNLTKMSISSPDLSHIGKLAFYKTPKLKTFIVKSSKLTTGNVGKKVFSGIKATAAFSVPSSKVSSYKSQFRSKGAGSKITVKAV